MAARAAVERVAAGVRRHPWFVAWLSFLPVLFIRAGTMAESDTFWQVRTGILTLSHWSLPTTDPYSWTALGRPWRLNSWGFNVVVGALDHIGGLAAVALGSEAIVAAALWVVLLLAKRRDAHPFVAAVSVHVAILLLFTFLSARPQVVDYLAVLLIVLLLDDLIGSRGRPWRLVAAIGIVSVLWVNLHATTIMGVGLIGAVAAGTYVLPSTRSRTPWCLAALLAALAGMLANPYGVDVVRQSFEVADASTESIVEWQRLDLGDPGQLLPLLVGVLGLVIAVRRRDVLFIAILAATSVSALYALRMLPFATLAALPLVASAASTAVIKDYIHSRRVMLTQGVLPLMALLLVLAAPVTTHLGRPDPDTYSAGLVAQLPQGCHLFNSYPTGGFVILARPDVRVSIDSRNDMYGERLVNSADRAIKRPRAADLAGAGCALVPSGSGAARWLSRRDDWRRVDSDAIAVLYVRR
ncbi:hypothetical protein [Aeromicrobium sp. 9AM]|uniref:hypothetical protein n=1 Tax=Aeromicrobium sp. 9AM TaxID=2653126 RepID=UPI0012F0B865|nr:hypothetical protein [Aeromicrobium sp. 9AM]VXB69930.1 conserved membrane hypothetical protein [Aeromicrobium sp. 9AM]